MPFRASRTASVPVRYYHLTARNYSVHIRDHRRSRRYHHRCAASCLVFLRFELRHSLLRGLHSFSVYAHQLIRVSERDESSGIRRKVKNDGATVISDLTSSTSPGVIVKGGDIIMLSPATLTSMPRFWHSCPKIAPTPEYAIRETVCKDTFWFSKRKYILEHDQ